MHCEVKVCRDVPGKFEVIYQQKSFSNGLAPMTLSELIQLRDTLSNFIENGKFLSKDNDV